MKKITVLLADDHIVVREGLRMLVETEGDIEVVGEAKTGREAVDMTLRLRPSVVVMDIAMPLLNGLQATRQISEQLPQRECSFFPHMPIPNTSNRSSCLARRDF
jgi:DNA-binding NarL/FixJ family response regulator